MTWDSMSFWQSKEWPAIEERLDALERQGIKYNPEREDLFSSLDATPFADVCVCILGQDPYPKASLATGIAFSIPRGHREFPPTLINIFKEYAEDLHYPFPTHGDLTSWTKQGVLLWNVVPTCQTNKPGSHRDWEEWGVLTKEIVEKLGEKEHMVFVSLGGLSRCFLDNVDHSKHRVLSYSHPSPLGASKTKSPFLGSRMFTTINDYLCRQGQDKIDWRLD